MYNHLSYIKAFPNFLGFLFYSLCAVYHDSDKFNSEYPNMMWYVHVEVILYIQSTKSKWVLKKKKQSNDI